MSFVTNTWIDRVSDNPNRRTLVNVNDSSDVKTVDITRAEGTVSVQGTPLNASALNDLESRILAMNTSLVGSAIEITLPANSWNSGVTAASNQEIMGLPATSAVNIQNNQKLQQANLMDYGQTDGQITLYAENIPTEDLTIRVIVRV